MAFILFRAYANQLAPLGQYRDTLSTTLFFEAPAPELAVATATRLVAAAWNIHQTQLDVYAVFDEDALIEMSGLPASHGDVRLMVCGWNSGPLFIDPARTMLTGRPATIGRLYAATRAAARWRADEANLAAYAGLPRPHPMALRESMQRERHPLRRRSDVSDLSYGGSV